MSGSDSFFLTRQWSDQLHENVRGQTRVWIGAVSLPDDLSQVQVRSKSIAQIDTNASRVPRAYWREWHCSRQTSQLVTFSRSLPLQAKSEHSSTCLTHKMNASRSEKRAGSVKASNFYYSRRTRGRGLGLIWPSVMTNTERAFVNTVTNIPTAQKAKNIPTSFLRRTRPLLHEVINISHAILYVF